MKLEDLLRRADELLKLGTETLSTAVESNGGSYVDNGMFSEFRAAALSFLKRTFGAGSPHYEDFHSTVTDIDGYRIENGMGVLKACRAEIVGGWLVTTKGLVSAEVFTDFFSMAEHLLSEGYKDPAAVMVGSVLEEHLRQLCQKNSIPIEDAKPGSSPTPRKADTMNAELAKANVYNKLDQKNVTAWLDLRNKAAHGKYSEYNAEQVDNTLRSVSEFIARTPL